MFRDIGLLDEGYYTYFDDCDFCFNARKTGWPTWYVPASRVVHLVGQSDRGYQQKAQTSPALLFEARRRYFLKNHNARLCRDGGCRANHRARFVAAARDPYRKGGFSLRHFFCAILSDIVCL